jgi:hypothetical protein
MSSDDPGRPRSLPRPNDLDLLQIEVEILWTLDQRGRIDHRDLVLASSTVGLSVTIGSAVPDELAEATGAAVAAASPPQEQHLPPDVLAVCQYLLEQALGPVELAPGSGPSYLIPDTVEFPADVPLVRSDDADRSALRGANPGNWGKQEWEQLLAGSLGPWAMAMQAGQVVSICHTPASGKRGAEAGVWTRPGFRGRGYAAAVTVAWASLMRPNGRWLFYSTSRTNFSSQRVAARLALRPIGSLWQLARVRSERIVEDRAEAIDQPIDQPGIA